MYIPAFLSKTNLFDPTPARQMEILVPLLIFFSLIVLFGLVLRIVVARKNPVFKRFAHQFIICGLCGLAYIFGRYETLPWLGSGIFLLAVAALFIFWLSFNIVWTIKHVPPYLKQQQAEEKYHQYLPKSKIKK